MSTKALKQQLIAAIAMVLVAAIALGSSTYAWFVNNTKVTASSVTVTAQAANNLLITHGNGTIDAAWGTTATMGTFTTTNFKPVSTIGASTAVTDLSFYKDSAWATEATGTEQGKYNASGFTTATAGTEYYKDTLTLKASQASKLYLDTETVFTAAGSDNETNKTLRLALVVHGAGNNTTDGVYIYQVDKTTLASGSTYNTTKTDLDADGIIKAINGTSTASNILGANVDVTNGVKKFLAGAAATENALATAPDSTAMATEFNAADVLYTFEGADDTVTIDVYVWMEGCDYDCNSTSVKLITEKSVTATLGFCVGAAT